MRKLHTYAVINFMLINYSGFSKTFAVTVGVELGMYNFGWDIILLEVSAIFGVVPLLQLSSSSSNGSPPVSIPGHIDTWCNWRPSTVSNVASQN